MRRERRIDYKATNILTGQILVAGAEELAQMLNATANAVYRGVSANTKVKGVWEISKVQTDTALIDPQKNFPYSLRVEWDNVTKPFKELSRRKAERKNKI